MKPDVSARLAILAGNPILLVMADADIALRSEEVPPAEALRTEQRVLAALDAISGLEHTVAVLCSRVDESRMPSPARSAVRSLSGRLEDLLLSLSRETGATDVLMIGGMTSGAEAYHSSANGPSVVSLSVGSQLPRGMLHLDSADEVPDALEALLALRISFLESRRLIPLDRCAVLSDQRTLAVLSPDANVIWLCLPRIDSPAIFSELVGGQAAGHWSIRPAGSDGSDPETRYLGDSFTLRTAWPNLSVTDFLECSGERAMQRPGRCNLLRIVDGAADSAVRFAPRLDFGRTATRLKHHPEGLEIEGSLDPIVLHAPGLDWQIVDEGRHQTALCFLPASRLPFTFDLRYGTASLRPPSVEPASRLDRANRFWASWAASLRLPSVRPDLVRRSALVLKALCFGPTGAIAAAATTSLPELLGGQRNWDYRYCWPRDAALACAALIRLGNTGHALRFLDWVLGIVDRIESPDRLHPIYTVSGAFLPPEAELTHLEGYGQSRPVRIGNAAANQVQLDVFGPIVDLVAMLAEMGAPVAPDHWRLVRAMVRAVETRWQEPDHGIWEMRADRRHHVHSRTMCWHTIKRALVVEDVLYSRQNPEWEALRDRIAADVLANGWNNDLQAFAAAYGHGYVDAAVLMLGLAGLVPHEDPRWHGTVRRIESELRRGPSVRRYNIDDGLPGPEGGLLLCTGWLIESLLTVGRIDDAQSLFDELADLVRSPGIMTEEYDQPTDRALGNIAQAYSHLALINAAVAIDRVRNS